MDALADDLNTHGALAECHALSGADDFAGLRGTMELLGLFDGGVPAWVSAAEPDLGAFAEILRAARETALASKDFAEVDRLKAAFLDAGVEVRMTRTEVELVAGEDFDPAKLESLK